MRKPSGFRKTPFRNRNNVGSSPFVAENAEKDSMVRSDLDRRSRHGMIDNGLSKPLQMMLKSAKQRNPFVRSIKPAATHSKKNEIGMIPSGGLGLSRTHRNVHTTHTCTVLGRHHSAGTRPVTSRENTPKIEQR